MCHKRLKTLILGLAGGWGITLAGPAAAQTGNAGASGILRQLTTDSGVEIDLGPDGGLAIKIPDRASGGSASPFSRSVDNAAQNSSEFVERDSTRVERDSRGIRVRIPAAAGRISAAIPGAVRGNTNRAAEPVASVDLPPGVADMIQSLVPELRSRAGGRTLLPNDQHNDARAGFAVELDTVDGRLVVNQEGIEAYAAAVRAFRQADYPNASKYANTAVEAMPKIEKFLQFRGLSRFAMKEFELAAEDLYEALKTGAAWDWPTVANFYGDVADYASRYSELQRASQAKLNSVELQFLVAYHHMILGHHDAAMAAWQRTESLLPDDPVVNEQMRRLQTRPAPLQPVDSIR